MHGDVPETVMEEVVQSPDVVDGGRRDPAMLWKCLGMGWSRPILLPNPKTLR
ncbi:UNVERIFIED_CONTAM: hypothetical protein Sradi_6206900 [Sesamum radiatum]|uniref:Uncharacterized protein n=1 Tax=Sesamum radiatum TaxID=300843 RepID=A0AAW2KAK3_SESRA